MLGMKNYTKDYVAACRERVEADLKAYRKQVGKEPNKDFETRFFNAQVLVLEHMFVHRLAGVEGKDGNPLNELRVLCNSLLYNGGTFQVEKLAGWPNSAGGAVKLVPEKSILKLKNGDAVKLTEADFVRLSNAFFKTLVEKYV